MDRQLDLTIADKILGINMKRFLLFIVMLLIALTISCTPETKIIRFELTIITNNNLEYVFPGNTVLSYNDDGTVTPLSKGYKVYSTKIGEVESSIYKTTSRPYITLQDEMFLERLRFSSIEHMTRYIPGRVERNN